jgi:hypothetical protein
MWGVTMDNVAPALRVLTLAAGLVAIGSALALYLPTATPDLEGRLYSGGLWLLGAVALYASRVGLGSHFDSFHVLLTALTLAAGAAALLSALPRGWRFLAGTVLVLLHFAAILTAVTVVPPPEGPSPYVSNHMWNRVRGWLQLTVLNNGYHFYAPEPGPSALLWFRVEFNDGAATWVRIPDHNKVSTHIERRRLGALATSCGPTAPVDPARLEQLRENRLRAGQNHEPPIPPRELPPPTDYREPTFYVLQLLSSFVRRVARTTEHPDGKDSPVRSVKVYRVDYANPPVEHFQAGRDPLDPTLYLAIYMGEYGPDGSLSERSLRLERERKDGPVTNRVQDPFLYWRIPIERVATDDRSAPEVGPARRMGEPGAWRSEGRIINYVRIHAGDKKDQESIP